MARTKKSKPGGVRRRGLHDNTHNPDSVGEGPGMPLGLKKRIRDVKRLLQHAADMPADQRVAKEREIQSLQYDLDQRTTQRRKAKMIKRYHKIRFFERQKAERQLKKLNRAVAECTDPTQREFLSQHQHIAQVDLNYAMYYPLLQPYSSLYPPNTNGANKKLENGDWPGDLPNREGKEWWTRVEAATEEGGQALQALRDELPKESSKPEAARQKPNKANAKPAKHSKRPSGSTQTVAANEQTEDEDDDNFFE